MFYVLLAGEGQGCDYTIDCNKTWVQLKAEKYNEALKEVAKVCNEYGEIAEALILEVKSEFKFDIEGWEKACLESAMKREAESNKADRRVQYERLKQEFEQPPSAIHGGQRP